MAAHESHLRHQHPIGKHQLEELQLLLAYGKLSEMTQVLEALLPSWQTWMEFYAPGFTLAQFWPLWSSGNEPVDGRYLPLALCATMFQINKNIYKNKEKENNLAEKCHVRKQRTHA